MTTRNYISRCVHRTTSGGMAVSDSFSRFTKKHVTIPRKTIVDVFGHSLDRREGVPWGSYRVTYRIDPRGEFIITLDKKLLEPSVTFYPDVNEHQFRVPVCFLSDDWIGHRVSRRVKKIKKRRIK